MILHITNDFSGSTVYKNLIRELDNLCLSQIVYNPIKEKSRIGKNKIDLKAKDSKIIYSHILNKTTDRIFYKQKIKKILKDIESKVDLSKITFIHAHTWFSDGGVAYLLSKKYNIPFIIATRSTDLVIHYKYLIHKRKFGFDILKKANDIILIGEYQKTFFNKIKIDNITSKVKVIPNGVDEFWIKNNKEFSRHPISKFKFLYVGTFIKRKKLLELQQAIVNLSKNYKVDCLLHIVGEGGKQTTKILNIIEQYPDLFIYHGKVNKKEDLMKIYNECHFFTMPSKNETFGLVYVEALLQGLPILYTTNEGIDGFYKEKIGEKVSKKADVSEISQAILKLIGDYDSYEIPTQKLLNKHDWKKIAKKYLLLYNKNNNSNL